MGNPAGVRRDFQALEQRRLRAARLLKQGVHQSEVARQVGAHRQSVSRWAQQLEAAGLSGLRKAGRAGRKPRLQCGRSEEDRARAEAWAGSSGLRNRFVDGVAGGAPDRGRMRGPLPCLAGLAHPASAGMELSAAHWAGVRAGRREDPDVETKALAGVKKKAKNEGRTIVFIDESGLSERPHRCRTWAPRGQTPVLQYHFNWKTLSAMAGVTWWNFYFRLFPGAIRSPQIIEFLSHLLRHIPGKLLIVWDGLPGHRSRMVWDFVRQQRGRLWLEFLPAYAPELNPVEYLWSHWKQHELPNFCPTTFRAVELPCAPSVATDASTSNSGDRLLAAGRPVSIVTILCNAQ